jgi:pimeloyl-ACP methyl ester carboxylesterase
MDEFRDDDLTQLEQSGIPPLPPDGDSGVVLRDGASLWCASWGNGPAVLLLHGGLGNAGNWGRQVPAILAAGYRVIVMDTRGHGRSSWDGTPFSYQRLAEDAVAVLEHFGVARAAVVGWSDGADTGLILPMQHPERVAGLVFFACNVDASGVKPFEMTETIGRIFARHVADHAALSPDPGGFDAMQQAVGLMQGSQPNLTAADLGRVAVPVLSLIGESDEFITRAHAEYIAASVPGARFRLLAEISHFAPLQRPEVFNATVLDFLAAVSRR